METRQVAVVALLAAVGVALLATPALGLGFVADDGGDNETEAAFGTEVAAFAQATAESANGTVDRGMWAVAVNTTDRPDEAIEQRTAVLEKRLDRLEERIADLQAEREAGNLPEPAYQARAAALRSQLQNVQESLDQTSKTAVRVGVNATRLETLRSNAANMTGPEVAAAARNITDAPRGPPEDAGPPDGIGNGSDGGPPDDAGPPEDGESDNGTDTGPPDDAGPPEDGESDDGSDGGPPDDAGPPEDGESDNGTDAGPPEDGGSDDDGDDGESDDDADVGPPGDDERPGNGTDAGQYRM